MLEAVRRHCKRQLTSGLLDAILGVREQIGGSGPYSFFSADEVDNLVIDKKQPLIFTCRPTDRNLINLLQEQRPGLRLGIVARGCDERTLFELAKRFQLSLDGIEVIGIACDQAQAKECRCSRPFPENLKYGAKIENDGDDPDLVKFLSMSLEERFTFWQYQFGKCMKCYGCRNACPMCFCKDCLMERELHVKRGVLPPDVPTFHLIGVLHHADNCIDCGECERACPMDIPLRLLRKSMRAAVQELFEYEPGVDATSKSPFATPRRGGLFHDKH
jgi:ferredoxin